MKNPQEKIPNTNELIQLDDRAYNALAAKTLGESEVLLETILRGNKKSYMNDDYLCTGNKDLEDFCNLLEDFCSLALDYCENININTHTRGKELDIYTCYLNYNENIFSIEESIGKYINLKKISILYKYNENDEYAPNKLILFADFIAWLNTLIL